MENILVAIDSKRGAWEAISHACSLAKRVDIRINLLLVLSGIRSSRSLAEAVILKQMKKRIDLHIEAAKTDGLTINYFIAEGDYRITSYNVCYTKLLRMEREGGNETIYLACGKNFLRVAGSGCKPDRIVLPAACDIVEQ